VLTPYIKIAAFLKRRVKALKYMPREDLLYWIVCHDKKGSLAYHEVDGKILSAGVARPLHHPAQRVNSYDFFEGGEYIYAEHAASTSPQSFAVLIETMKKRFPYGIFFAYRHAKTGKVRTWNLNRFLEVTTMKAYQLETKG
jgi:hypothetical protein